MKILSRYGCIVPLCVALLFGCESNDKQSSTSQNNDVVVTGSAIKGVLNNAAVMAYTESREEPIANTLTDAFGKFILRIPQEYRGQPLFIEVEALANQTLMRCDLASGCGDVLFGEFLEISEDDEFILKSAIAELIENQSINVSLLTDLATSLALNEVGLNRQELAEAINNAYSQIADRFGIIGDIALLEQLDITSAKAIQEALENGQLDAIELSTLGAAIIEALMQKSPELTTAQAIKQFKPTYLNKGLADVSSNSAELDTSSVWSAALSTVEVIREQCKDDTLDQVYSKMLAKRDLAKKEKKDLHHWGHPSHSANLKGLNKVKNMVSELRDLQLSLGNDAILTGGKSLERAADEFSIQLKGAETAADSASIVVAKALAEAAYAIAEAAELFGESDSEGSFLSSNNVQVQFFSDENTSYFKVDEDITLTESGTTESVAVELLAHVDYKLTDRSGRPFNNISSGRMAFLLNGKAKGEQIMLSIEQPSSLRAKSSWLQEKNDSSIQAIYKGQLAFDLKVNIEEIRTDAAPVGLTGVLSANFDGISAVRDEATLVAKPRLSMAALSFAGELGTDYDAVGFAVNLVGNTRKMDFDALLNAANPADEAEAQLDDLSANATAAFYTNLAGILGLVQVELNVSKVQDKFLKTQLSLRLPGQQLSASLKVIQGKPDKELLLTNQDGVSLHIKEKLEKGEQTFVGTLTYRDRRYATIETGRFGPIIRYIDDSVESL